MNGVLGLHYWKAVDSELGCKLVIVCNACGVAILAVWMRVFKLRNRHRTQLHNNMHINLHY